MGKSLLVAVDLIGKFADIVFIGLDLPQHLFLFVVQFGNDLGLNVFYVLGQAH